MSSQLVVPGPGRDTRPGRRAETELAVVVVPARDEEARIAGCLASLQRARRHREVAALDVRIVLVLDSCHDGTAAAATPHLGDDDHLMTIPDGNVGVARRMGLAHALLMAGDRHLDSVWLATTDADSVVGDDWLARQLRWRALAFDGVAGMVRVDSWRQHPRRARRRYHAHVASLGTRLGHPHVHGANLGFSATSYTAVGGMPSVETGEDHALWAKLSRAGFQLVAADDVVVVTSGRTIGRAPDGFAALLTQFASPRSGWPLASGSGRRRLRFGS
jgi:glycosyltransferase involved in cell wall biosynthesis